MIQHALAFWFALGLALLARGAEATPSRYARVHLAPAKTSIYVGTVSMTMPVLERSGDVYETTYTAKVRPYFFYNERGKLQIEITDGMLRQLEGGEAVEFKGRAVRSDGEERRLEGKATPTSSSGGKVKVRVFVSTRLELIFNTTYRFDPPE